MTTISVILPAFRAEPFLQRAVRSIQAQTITDWEVVIALEHGLAISQIRLLHHPSGRLLPNRVKPAAEGVLPLEEIYPACLHAYAAIAFDRTAIGRRWNVKVPLLEDAVFLAEASSERPAIWYSPEPLYAYYHRGDSLCNAPGSAARFLRAGAIVLELLERGELLLSDHAARVLRTYITRNNAIEQAFAHAVESGAVRNYQDFLGKSQHALRSAIECLVLARANVGKGSDCRHRSNSTERPLFSVLRSFSGEGQVSRLEPPLIASGRMTGYDPMQPVGPLNAALRDRLSVRQQRAAGYVRLLILLPLADVPIETRSLTHS